MGADGTLVISNRKQAALKNLPADDNAVVKGIAMNRLKRRDQTFTYVRCRPLLNGK